MSRICLSTDHSKVSNVGEDVGVLIPLYLSIFLYQTSVITVTFIYLPRSSRLDRGTVKVVTKERTGSTGNFIKSGPEKASVLPNVFYSVFS